MAPSDDAPVEPNSDDGDGEHARPVLTACQGMYVPAVKVLLLRQVVVAYTEEEMAKLIEEGQAAYEEALALAAKDKKAPQPDEFDPEALPRDQRWLSAAVAESGRRVALQLRVEPSEPPPVEEGEEPPPPPPTEWELGTSVPSSSGELLLRGVLVPAQVPVGPATLTIREATAEMEPIAFPRFEPIELQVTIEPPPPPDGEEPPPEDPKKKKGK